MNKIMKKIAIVLGVVSIICLAVPTNVYASQKIGWVKTEEGWKYFKSVDNPYGGWLLDNGEWYNLSEKNSRIMQTGWFQDHNGNWYYFKENGAMAKDVIIDGCKFNSSGAWVDKNGEINKGVIKQAPGSGTMIIEKDYLQVFSDGYKIEIWMREDNEWGLFQVYDYTKTINSIPLINTMWDACYTFESAYSSYYDNQYMIKLTVYTREPKAHESFIEIYNYSDSNGSDDCEKNGELVSKEKLFK